MHIRKKTKKQKHIKSLKAALDLPFRLENLYKCIAHLFVLYLLDISVQ